MTPAIASRFSGGPSRAAARRRRAGLHFQGRRRVDHVQVAQLLGILVQRMAGDEKPEHLFFRLQPLVLIPVGSVGQVVGALCAVASLIKRAGQAGK